MSEEQGYSKDRCHFCGKRNAGFGRAEDANPSGPFFDACQDCVRKPYPAPKEFLEHQTEAA